MAVTHDGLVPQVFMRGEVVVRTISVWNFRRTIEFGKLHEYLYRLIMKAAVRRCAALAGTQGGQTVRAPSPRRASRESRKCRGEGEASLANACFLSAVAGCSAPRRDLIRRRHGIPATANSYATTSPPSPRVAESDVAVDLAAMEGTGVGFSAGGMLFPYLIGVLSALREEGVMTGVVIEACLTVSRVNR